MDPAFEEVHAHLGAIFQKRFKDARREELFGIDAWVAPLANPPGEEAWKGTMPRDKIVLGPTRKKAGITIHIWHPLQPDLLKQNEAWLSKAGFKVMVGCLQWNRKAPLPAETVEALLEKM